MCAALKTVRDRRIWPGWDDKVLADWNGLMICGLVEAAITLGRPDWLAAARRAFDAVIETHGRPGDRLFHRRGGKAHHPATARIANMARAGVRLFEVTGDPVLLDWAALDSRFDAHFWDAANGAYFTTADVDDVFTARKLMDNAVPAANGVMAGRCRGRLLTGEDEYQRQPRAGLCGGCGADSSPCVVVKRG